MWLALISARTFTPTSYFPRGLTNLVSVDLGLCQLTNLTLAPDMTQLTTLFVDGNPFTTFVISEPMAATNLAALVTSLQNQGVSVRTISARGEFIAGSPASPGKRQDHAERATRAFTLSLAQPI